MKSYLNFYFNYVTNEMTNKMIIGKDTDSYCSNCCDFRPANTLPVKYKNQDVARLMTHMRFVCFSIVLETKLTKSTKLLANIILSPSTIRMCKLMGCKVPKA